MVPSYSDRGSSVEESIFSVVLCDDVEYRDRISLKPICAFSKQIDIMVCHRLFNSKLGSHFFIVAQIIYQPLSVKLHGVPRV